MSHNSDIVSVLLDLVEINMNNKTEEIVENLVSDGAIEKLDKENLKLALRCIKLSTLYSAQTLLEIFLELNLIDLNHLEFQNAESMKKKLHSLTNLRVMKNQKNEE